MKKRIIFVYVIIAALLAACGGGGGEEDSPPEASESPAAAVPEREAEPGTGGSLTLSMRHPLTLNPLLNEDETVDRVLSLMFEKLYLLDEELRPAPNPALLTGASVSADGKTWTLNVREDIYWSDGSPVTAADVAFSIEYLKTQSPAGAVYKECAANMLSASASGSAVRVSLIEPSAQMGYALCFPVIPQAYYKGVSASGEKQMLPLGNGVYTLESRTMRELRLAASPASLRGPAYIQNITVVIPSPDEADINAFIHGVTDAAPVTTTGWNLARGQTDFNAAEYVSGYFDFIGFNFDSPAVAVREVRVAVARLLPYSGILESVYKNAAALAPTPVSPASWLCDKNVRHMTFDAAAAAALLAETGAAGTEFRILVNSENAERVKVAETLALNLATAGASADIRSLPMDEYTAALIAGDFDIYLGGYKLSAMPDLAFMLYTPYSPDPAALTNYQRYSSASMDKFLADAYAARDDDAVRHAYSELQNLIAYDLPVIGLVFRENALLTAPGVSGPPAARFGDVFYNIEKWFVK